MKIGSVTSSFDIVQFSRSCAPQPQRLTTWLFYHRSSFLSSTFWRSFWSFTNLERFEHLSVNWCFQRLLVLFKGFLLRLQKSFFCLSAWRSSIIPHPRTIVNTFWQVFSKFFAEGVNSLSQSLRLCQLPRGGSLWRNRKLYAYTGNCTVMPRAPSLRGLASRSDDWGSFSGGVLSALYYYII